MQAKNGDAELPLHITQGAEAAQHLRLAILFEASPTSSSYSLVPPFESKAELAMLCMRYCYNCSAEASEP